MTEQLFEDESEETEDYLTDMPPLSDSDPLLNVSGSEGKDEDYEERMEEAQKVRGASFQARMQKARRRSLIETPHSQRAKRQPSDDDFIVSDDDEPSINQTSDEDYVPTEEESADFDARLALVVQRSREEVAEPDARKPDDDEDPRVSAMKKRHRRRRARRRKQKEAKEAK